MMADFLGNFFSSINKQRVMIPSALQKSFPLIESGDKPVVVTLGPDHTIAVYPVENWNKLITKLRNGDVHQKKMMMSLRYLAMPIQTLEGPGRIKISDELLAVAKINDKDKVRISGESSYIRIMSKAAYDIEKQQILEEHMQSITALDYEL